MGSILPLTAAQIHEMRNTSYAIAEIALFPAGLSNAHIEGGALVAKKTIPLGTDIVLDADLKRALTVIFASQSVRTDICPVCQAAGYTPATSVYCCTTPCLVGVGPSISIRTLLGVFPLCNIACGTTLLKKYVVPIPQEAVDQCPYTFIHDGVYYFEFGDIKHSLAARINDAPFPSRPNLEAQMLGVQDEMDDYEELEGRLTRGEIDPEHIELARAILDSEQPTFLFMDCSHLPV